MGADMAWEGGKSRFSIAQDRLFGGRGNKEHVVSSEARNREKALVAYWTGASSSGDPLRTLSLDKGYLYGTKFSRDELSDAYRQLRRKKTKRTHVSGPASAEPHNARPVTAVQRAPQPPLSSEMVWGLVRRGQLSESSAKSLLGIK